MDAENFTLAAEVPLSDHVARFWRYLETEHVRIMVDLRRVIGEDKDIIYWDGASFSDDVAKALVAERLPIKANSEDREVCECPRCGKNHWKLGNPPNAARLAQELRFWGGNGETESQAVMMRAAEVLQPQGR